MRKYFKFIAVIAFLILIIGCDKKPVEEIPDDEDPIEEPIEEP